MSKSISNKSSSLSCKPTAPWGMVLIAPEVESPRWGNCASGSASWSWLLNGKAGLGPVFVPCCSGSRNGRRLLSSVETSSLDCCRRGSARGRGPSGAAVSCAMNSTICSSDGSALLGSCRKSSARVGRRGLVSAVVSCAINSIVRSSAGSAWPVDAPAFWRDGPKQNTEATFVNFRPACRTSDRPPLIGACVSEGSLSRSDVERRARLGRLPSTISC